MLANFTLLSLLSIAAGIVSAFRVPEGTVDGVYRTYLNESGFEIHEHIAPLKLEVTDRRTAASLEQRSSVSPRQLDKWINFCHCGDHVDHGNADAASDNLKVQLGGGQYIYPQSSWYAIRGNVIAFACNPYTDSAVASARAMELAIDHINANCGAYIAAASWHDAANGLVAYMGTMNWWGPAQDVCNDFMGWGPRC